MRKWTIADNGEIPCLAYEEEFQDDAKQDFKNRPDVLIPVVAIDGVIKKIKQVYRRIDDDADVYDIGLQLMDLIADLEKSK